MSTGSIQAEYFDGETTRPQQAEVSVLADGLLVRPAEGGTTVWPFDELSRLDAPAAAGLRLAVESRPGARLTVRDGLAATRLIEAMPRLKRARASGREARRTVKWIAGGAAALAAVGLLAFEGLPRAAAYVPMSWLAPIGDNVRAQVTDFLGAFDCASPESQAALDRLAGRLVAGAPADVAFDPALIDVMIVYDATPNALAAPGGRILLFSGILEIAGESPGDGGDMVAGVLAHEIAHARLRHPTRALGRSLGLEFLAQLAGAGYGADASLLLAQLAYGREAEREADALGREMLIATGIGDAGLAAFFRKLTARFGEDDGDDAYNFFSTHPPTAERAEAGPGQDGTEWAFTLDEWDALRRDCAD